MAIPKVSEKEKQLNLETITWGDLTWIHIERPTERETGYLASRFPFHPLNLDDALSRIQRPKIDIYEDHLFIVLHFPFLNQDTQVMLSSELDIFIGKDYLVTIDCSGNLKTVAKFFKLYQSNEEARQANLRHGSGYLLYRIVDQLVDYCLPMVNKIADDVEQVEDNIFSNSARGTVRELSTLRRHLISFRRIIWPMRAVIGGLEPKIHRFTDLELADYFGDTVDHLDKIWDALDEYKEIIEGLNETSDSLASHRINDVLRVLTILATISTVLTVVVSYFGMNVPLPGGANPGGGSSSWLIILLVMLTIISGMLLYFRRKHWL